MAYDPDPRAAAQRLIGEGGVFLPYHLSEVELEVKYHESENRPYKEQNPFLKFIRFLSQDRKIDFDPQGFQADSAPLLSIFFHPSRSHNILQSQFHAAGWQFRVRFPLAFKDGSKLIRLEASAKTDTLHTASRIELEHTIIAPRKAYCELRTMHGGHLPIINSRDFRSISGCITARNGIYFVLSLENSPFKLMFYLTYDDCNFLDRNLSALTRQHKEIEVEYIGCFSSAREYTNSPIENSVIMQGFGHLDVIAAMAGLTRADQNKCEMANSASFLMSAPGKRGLSLRQLFEGRQFDPLIARFLLETSPIPATFTPILRESLALAR